jgi:NifU-like protein involved in Fe-S cluster formation
MFTNEVIKRFKNPKNVGDLSPFNALGKAGDPSCSDVIEIKIQFSNDRIKNARFKVFGCPGAVSTTDVFIDMIKGKTIEEALHIKQEDISQKLGGLPIESMHCTHLPLEAFRKALDDYKSSIKK